MSGDRLANVKVNAAFMPRGLRDDVFALVEIAKAARDVADHSWSSLDESMGTMIALRSALARLDSGALGDRESKHLQPSEPGQGSPDGGASSGDERHSPAPGSRTVDSRSPSARLASPAENQGDSAEGDVSGGLESLRRIIADECIATDDDVEVLRRLLDMYEAVSPLVDPTHEVPQLEWNAVMSRLRFAVSRFESGAAEEDA